VSDYTVIALSPETQARGFLSDLVDKGRARREEHQRAADLFYDQQERDTLALLGRAPATAAQAIEAMVGEEVDDDLTRRRAHSLVDRALNEGMEFQEIKARLALEPPGLRSEKLRIEREQRERKAARTPEQVRLDELQQELTQVKSKLHALGG
jgi:hypothetical protein